MGAGETFNGRPFSKVLMLQLEVSRAGSQKGKWKGMGPTGTSRESEPHKDRQESFRFSLAQIIHLQDGDVLQEKLTPLSYRKKVITMVSWS